MVDHIEFETASLIETFLEGWRKTGIQRFGYLYGKHEKHLDVPLGIKAVVAFIYEPPQQGLILFLALWRIWRVRKWDPNFLYVFPGNIEGVELELPDKDEEEVNKLAKRFGLHRVLFGSSRCGLLLFYTIVP